MGEVYGPLSMNTVIGDGRYLKLDGSNGPMTGDLEMTATKKLILGNANRYIVDSGNDILITNLTTGGDVKIDGKATVDIKVASANSLVIDTGVIYLYKNTHLVSAKQLRLGADTRYITDDGTDMILKTTANAIQMNGKTTLELKTNDTSRAYIDSNGLYVRPASDIIKGGDNGSALSLKVLEEEIEVAAGTDTQDSTIQAPAGALVMSVTGRVTQAPGGGAATFDVRMTGDGNASLGDDVSTALDTTFEQYIDGDGNRSAPFSVSSATTFNILTNANVTGANLKVRIIAFYLETTAPTS